MGFCGISAFWLHNFHEPYGMFRNNLPNEMSIVKFKICDIGQQTLLAVKTDSESKRNRYYETTCCGAV